MKMNIGTTLGRLMGAFTMAMTLCFLSVIHAVGADPVSTRVVVLLGPAKASPSWQPWAETVVNKLAAGEMPPHAVSVNSPTDYRGIHYQVSATNLAYSTTAHSWEGNFSPTGLFAQERGTILWYFTVSTSVDSSDSIALSQVMFKVTSSEGSLNSTDSISPVTGTYVSTAIGIRADGSRITSGSSTQKAAKVIVGFAGLSYIANSPSDLQEVVNYVKGMSSFKINIAVEVKDGDTRLSSSLITLRPNAASAPAVPPLSVQPTNANQIVLSLQGGSAENSYVVQKASAVTGPWVDSTLVLNQAGTIIVQRTEPQQFFRVFQQ